MKLLICLALVAAATASYHGNNQHSYQGHFYGKCGNDGIYYNDESSFMFCSNGNSYHQPCAPGSRNRGPNSYKQGGHYGFNEFCGVNLVNHGYAAHGYGHQPHPQQSTHNSYDDNRGYGDSHGYKQTVTYEKKEYQGNGYDSHSHGNGDNTHQHGNGYNTHQNGNGYNTHQHGNGYNTHQNGNRYNTHQQNNGYDSHSHDNGYGNDRHSQGYENQAPHGDAYGKVNTKTVVKKTYSSSNKH